MLFGVSQTDLDFVYCAVVIQALIASFKRILEMLEVLNFNFFFIWHLSINIYFYFYVGITYGRFQGPSNS